MKLKLSLPLSLFAVLNASVMNFFTIPTFVQAENTVKVPIIGQVKSITNDEQICHVTVVDDQGMVHEELIADFHICVNRKTFLKQKVRLYYGRVSMPDCETAKPCGKYKTELIIMKMQVINQ